MTVYTYDPAIEKELTWCARKLFGPSATIKRATLAEDFKGVDGQYVVDQVVPFQYRSRFNRPFYAADADITFRHTEPAMMAARTYAPLALFAWFTDGRIVAARCIDIYRMSRHLDPPFSDRPITVNGDGRTGFYAVGMDELWRLKALLKTFDGRDWGTGIAGGQQRLERIVKAYKEGRGIDSVTPIDDGDIPF